MWLKTILRRREEERQDRLWRAKYSPNIADLERTLAFDCPRCLQALSRLQGTRKIYGQKRSRAWIPLLSLSKLATDSRDLVSLAERRGQQVAPGRSA